MVRHGLLGMCFAYFYGGSGSHTSQWQPHLGRNTTPIYPCQSQPPGFWNPITAMANDAIAFMHHLN